MSDISSYRVELQRAESGAAWHLELLHVVKFAPIFFFFLSEVLVKRTCLTFPEGIGDNRDFFPKFGGRGMGFAGST